MKIMKKVRIKGALTAAITFVMMCAGMLIVQAASGSVTFGSSSYTVTEGEQFNIGVYVKSDVDIAAYTFYIDYDASKLEYVSGADSGNNGRLAFAGYPNSNYKKYWLTFKAKATGSCNVTVSDVYLGPSSTSYGDSLTVSKKGNSPITIKSAGSAASGNCDLKSIQIAETGFYGFSASKTSYDITVENKYDKLTVTAKAADSNATVTISDTSLKDGNNYIYITVTAQSGESKKYTITVRRKKADSTTGTTAPTETTTPQEPATIPGIDELKSYYSYNGIDLYFTKDLNGIKIPEGYSQIAITLDGHEVPALSNETGTIVLYYLVDGSEQAGALYVYSPRTNSISPYVVLKSKERSFMITDTQNPELPTGYQKVNMVIKGAGGEDGETSIIAWYHTSAPDFYLIYASCDGGEPELYQYDIKENTMQRYDGLVIESSDTDNQGSLGDTDKLKQEIETLKKQNKSEMKTWLIIVVILAILCIVLIIAVVTLVCRIREQMEYEPYEENEEEEAAEDDAGTSDSRNVQREKKQEKDIPLVNFKMPSAADTHKKPKYKEEDVDIDDDDFTFFDLDDDDKE